MRVNGPPCTVQRCNFDYSSVSLANRVFRKMQKVVVFQSWCEAKMPFNASCTSEGVNNQRKNKTSIWKVPITAWASAARTLHYTQLSFPAIKTNVSKGEMKKVENMTVERKMKQRKKKEKHLCKVLVKEAGLVITSLSQIEAEKKKLHPKYP